MSTTENQTFAELFVDGNKLNETELKEILAPYVKLGERGEFLPNQAYHSLVNKQKVVLFLLSQKVLKIVNKAEVESHSMATIAAATGMKEGSVKPIVSSLFYDNVLAKDESGKYLVPNYNISKIKQEFSNEAKK